MCPSGLPAPRLLPSLLLVGLLAPEPASGQDPGPISGYVFDARGSIINLGQDVEAASQRFLGPAQMPNWGWVGFDLGGHIYPLSLGPVTFGVGATLHYTEARRYPTEDEPDPDLPPVVSRFVAVSPQLSLNFGHRNGWSYLSGGLGTSRLTIYRDEGTRPNYPSSKTINYGGGARWFVSPRLAFTVDLRVFAINAIEQMGPQPGSPRMNRYAFSVGASFR